MADVIVINVTLDTREIDQGAERIARKLSNALDVGGRAAQREAARLQQALNLGITGRESRERQHAQRLEQIARISAAQIQAIEARKQAQLDLIRERGVQKALVDQRRLERATRDSAGGVDFLTRSVGRLSGAFVGLAAFGAVALFRSITETAQQAAIQIDRQVNTLKALTGSAEAAEKRFAQLVATAQKTPGLTTNLALTLDTQLRLLNTTEATINRVLPAIGRLNAIAPLGDPSRFAGNLVQLVTQGFEKQDLKELVGNSPFAGELIKEIFNVNSPTNAKAIREAAQKLGIDTVDKFFVAFAEAAEKNQKLQAVTESLGTQFEKLRDRLNIALAPVGGELAKIQLQIGEDLVRAVERFGPFAAQVFRENRVEIIETVRALGDLLVTLGKLTFELANIGDKDAFAFIRDSIREVALMLRTLQDLAELAAAGISFTFNSIVGGVATAVQKALGVIGVEFETLNNLVNDTFNAAQKAFARGQLGGINTRQLGERFATLDKFARMSPEQKKAFALGTGDLELLALAQAATPPPPSAGGGRTGAGGGRDAAEAAARARRNRFVPDFGLGQTAKLQHEIELARIRQSNAAVVARRELEQQQAGRPAQLAAHSAALAERIRQIEIEDATLARNTAQKAMEELAKIPPVLSASERFMKGFADATESAGDAFERFGANVARAFTNISDIFSGLKQAVLGFFNDLLGAALQNLVKSTLGSLFGGLSGSLGNLFRTPSFAGGFGGLTQAFAGGGGLSAPPSISSGIFGGLGSIFSGGGGSRAATSSIDQFFGASVPRTAGRIGGGFSFGAIGQSLAGAAPFLGLGIGSGLGGQSLPGQILGGAGGLLTGGVLASALSPGIFSGAAAALFSNPITAIAGVGLLVGGIFLGRAKQRRQDEEAAGQFLGQAFQAVEQLGAAIASDQVDGSQARAILESQIVSPFIQQINQLKTASVRRDWVKNQVPEIRARFEANVVPLIAAQEERRRLAQRSAAIDSRLIPQFASGGVVSGVDRGFDSVRALLRPGEMVLTQAQQSAIALRGGPDIFRSAGVPGVQPQATFQTGGIAPAGGPMVIELDLDVRVGMSQSGAEQIFVAGATNSRTGEDVVIRIVDRAQRRRGV